MSNSIARFQISADEDFRIQFVFVGLPLPGRTLRILVKERTSNVQRAALTIGSGLTLDGTDTVTALVPQATASAWARGEFETDLHDITGGANVRLVGARTIYDDPGRLPYGVIGAKATVQWVVNKAVVAAIGGIGPTGPTGPTGPAGPANALSVGTVTTGAAGSNAAVTITGASPNQTINLTIPRGDQGATGNTGATGPANTLTIGTVTTSPPLGAASATITGSAPNQTLNLTLPRGDQGPPGSVADGDKGDVIVSSAGTQWLLDPNGTLAQYAKLSGALFTGYSRISNPSDDQIALLINGPTKGIRFNTYAGGMGIEAVDSTGVGSYQPLSIRGTVISIYGQTGFELVPTFGVWTPWHSGNFTPSSYVLKDAAVFNGYARVEGGGGGYFYAKNTTGPTNKKLFKFGSYAGHFYLQAVSDDDTVWYRNIFDIDHDGWIDFNKRPTAGGQPLALVSDLPSLSRGAIAGLVLANNATTPNSKVDISTGQARDSTDTYDLRLASGITVDLAASGANGLDTGSKAASSTYHIYLIRRASDAALAGLASTSATSPALPSGYTAFRRLGAVVTDSSSNVRAFRQSGGFFEFALPVNDVPSQGNSGVWLRTLSVPSGIKVLARVFALVASDTVGYALLWDPDKGAPSATPQYGSVYHQASQVANSVFVEVLTNSASQIYSGDSGSNAFLNLYTHGWVDERGQYL